MRVHRTEVLVIGGGATGAAVLWDCALRGFDTMLVERADLVEGTSGRFHGLLHSGGRYVVKDPQAARECVAENVVLRRVAADTIEDTGGLFVSTPDDDPSYGDRFLEGAAKAGMPTEEIQVTEALRRAPRVNPGIRRAFTVADASIDAWKIAWAMARGAAEHRGRTLPYHRVTKLLRDGDRVVGAEMHDDRSDEDVRIDAGFVLNACGAWAAQIAELAGIRGLRIVPGRGVMIAMNHRIVHTVVNRCAMPADGDILVPIRTVCVIGTTDVDSHDPDDVSILRREVDQMLDDGERLVPGFRAERALRVWAGARPLFQDDQAKPQSTRDVSRAHALVDHAERDGVNGFLTITGGKLTTMRLMAEEVVDAMCRRLGEDRPCRTRDTPLPGSERGEHYRIGSRLRGIEPHPQDKQLICECELIERERLEETMRRRETVNLDDIRRSLRLGMGPCQGGFCIYRATGVLHGLAGLDGAAATQSLLAFLRERWKGVWPVLHGDQLRQAQLDDWIFQGLLDVEHLPREVPVPARAGRFARAGAGTR